MLVELDNKNKTCKYISGVDLTFVQSRLVNIASTITARYDAGICKHRLERTGVIEVECKENSNNCN